MKNVKVSYQNSKGETVSFQALDNWAFCGGDLFGFTASQNTLNNKIIGFGEEVVSYNIKCAFLDIENAEERNKLVDVISVDLKNNSKGKIIVGDNYRVGWITSIDFGEYSTERACSFTLVFSADTPYWIRQKKLTIEGDEREIGGLDFPHDYFHDYLLKNWQMGVIEQDLADSVGLTIVFSSTSNFSEFPSLVVTDGIFSNTYEVRTKLDEFSSIEIINETERKVIRHKSFLDENIFSLGTRTANKQCFAELPRGSYQTIVPPNIEATITLNEKRYLPWME